MIATDEVLDLTPDALRRVLEEMHTGQRHAVTFRFRVTDELLRSTQATRGALVMLAERVLGR